MSPIAVVAILAGAGLGAGLFLVVLAFAPGAPALGPALRNLTASTDPARQPAAVLRGSAGRFAGWLRIPYRELALVGHSPERYLTEKAAFSLIGLLFPGVFSLILALSGARLGVAVPAAAGVGLAVLFSFLVNVSVRQRAAEAREEFSRTVTVYLDLIALELAASRGPTEALERAAAVGGGWVSQRIRDSLEASRLQLHPPWDGLKRVATDIGVPDLGDVGDIMTLIGDEGAQVYDTLRSRADSLRATLLAKEEERANTATTALYIPTSLLVLVLFIVGAYPFLWRLVTT